MKEMLIPMLMDHNFEAMIQLLPDNTLEIYEVTVESENDPFTPLYIWNGFHIKEKDLINIVKAHRDVEIFTIKMSFDNKFAAMAWIYKNLIEKNNLTAERKKYLIGKRYEAEKAAYGASDGFRGNKYKKIITADNANKHKTRSEIARTTGTSEGYVKHAYSYSRGIDAAEHIYPGITEEILLKIKKIPACQISEVYKVPIQYRKDFLDDLIAKYTNQKRNCKRCDK